MTDDEMNQRAELAQRVKNAVRSDGWTPEESGGDIRKPLPTIPTPYTVIVDTREQRPFEFSRPLRVARLRKHFTVLSTRGTLPTGDYSLVGHESRIAIERKSLSDLFGTLGQGRERFTRELIRLAAIPHAAIVVEAEWSQIFLSPPRHSQLSPRTIFMSIVSWQIQFPNVHWWFLPSRDVAEACTIRLLDSYWRKWSAANPDTSTCDEPHLPTNSESHDGHEDDIQEMKKAATPLR